MALPHPIFTRTILWTYLSTLFTLQTLALQLPVRTIYQGSPGEWFENLRVRSNGSILYTRLDKPYLMAVDPSGDTAPQLIHSFPGYIGLVGITETERDLFAVVAGNFSLEAIKTYPGTYALWTVDYRNESCSATGEPTVRKLTDIPEAGLLNGATYIPSASAVMVADSDLGVIFRVDLHTGAYEIALNDTLTRKCNPAALEGINGIKFFRGQLYWTNSGCGFFATVAVNERGYPVGNASVVANPGVNFDDFAITADGTVYLASGFTNQIFRVTGTGEVGVVAGGLNSSEVAEPTALADGDCEEREEGVVFVSTAGALADPINGTTVVGGQILALYTQVED